MDIIKRTIKDEFYATTLINEVAQILERHEEAQYSGHPSHSGG
jgi:hypothetical protein